MGFRNPSTLCFTLISIFLGDSSRIPSICAAYPLFSFFLVSGILEEQGEPVDSMFHPNLIVFNLQEILSKRIYLCQLLVSLCIVREGGNFFCKLFDVFTPFSASFICGSDETMKKRVWKQRYRMVKYVTKPLKVTCSPGFRWAGETGMGRVWWRNY